MQGCDGSVLLDTTPFNSSAGVEKAAANNIGLRGFDVIDAIKAKLGDAVSCADIVVLAGRDATTILSRGRITYAVETGRKDGVVSSAAAADATLPESTFDINQLTDNFAAKNFTAEELVALAGAHAVGVSHLSSFRDRLNATTRTPISPRYQAALAGDVEALKGRQNATDPIEKFNIRDMDAGFRNASGFDAAGVDMAAVGVLDNSFYHANLQNMVLLRSDWELRNGTDPSLSDSLFAFRENATVWEMEFAAAMAKLSVLPAEGTRFEMRKSCRATN
jgi:peroxidase